MRPCVSAVEALSIRVIVHDDAASQDDLISFGLPEQSFAREAVDDGDTRFLVALGAGEAGAAHAASAR